jgi:hypothetical protein
LDRKGFLSVTMFQAVWMRRLLLISSMTLILRPPWDLGLDMSSQERKERGLVGFSAYTSAHQNLRIIELILFIKLLEKNTVDM